MLSDSKHKHANSALCAQIINCTRQVRESVDFELNYWRLARVKFSGEVNEIVYEGLVDISNRFHYNFDILKGTFKV